jgi:hypothetical protein
MEMKFYLNLYSNIVIVYGNDIMIHLEEPWEFDILRHWTRQT